MSSNKSKRSGDSRRYPADDRAHISHFHTELKYGRVLDTKGRTVPRYFELHRGGTVTLNDEAYQRLPQLFRNTMTRAGRFK